MMHMDENEKLYRISFNLPSELERILQDRAKENGRSYSQEVVQLVKAQLKQEERSNVSMTDLQPRRFSSQQRVALYLFQGGRCADCGVELSPSWHADHVDPWSKGG